MTDIQRVPIERGTDMSLKRPTGLRRLLFREDAPTKPATDPVADAPAESGPERDAQGEVSKETGRDTDLSHLAPAAATTPLADASGAARIESAAGRFLGDETVQVDPFDAAQDALDAKAGHIAGERERLRDEASHGLQDDAARDDGVTGVAEQGTGAASAEFSDLFSKEGRVRIFEDIFGGTSEGTAGARPGDDGVEATGPKVDLTEVDTSHLVNARLIQSNLNRGDEMTKEVVKRTPEGTVIEETAAGVRIATTPDGKVIRTDPDGTRSLTQPDGSTTTVHPNGDVTEQAPSTKQPDDENAFVLDPDHARLSGLDRFVDKLAPRPVQGGGHTDPTDDDLGFGTGATGVAAGAVPQAQDLLLGGNTRGLDRADGSGGSIDLDRALDPIRSGGAIDPTDDADPGFGGGGLEDDPLSGIGGPAADLSGRPDTAVVAGDEEGGTTTETDGSDGDAAGLSLPSFALADPDSLTTPKLFDGAPRFGLGVPIDEPIDDLNDDPDDAGGPF